jgi:long-chain acyl-CoA synthetase
LIFEGAGEAFRADTSRTAVTDDSRSRTWAEFATEVEQTAVELGNGSARPVEILLPSGNDFLRTFLAASIVGRPACTLHGDWAGPELEAAIAAVSKFAPGRDDADPLFYIGFTSGTSGAPKPFARRQKSWTSSFAPAGELFSVSPGDLVFLPGSLQHSHFLFGAVFALNRGAGIRLFERFDAALLARELRQTSKGVVYLVPTMLFALDQLGQDSFDGVHSVVVSGAKLEPHHWEIARRIFPQALIGELYGASELSFVAVNTEGEAASDPGFVGRPFPGVELEIRPPGNEAEDDDGVVYVRSPYLFDGYIEGSEIVSPVGEDGFMTVGDMGHLGEAGLSLSGRASNLLISGGKNVHPEEIEARLSEHPTVRECVVAGVPDRRWGEQLVAFLVAGDDRPTSAGLRDHLKGRVASYKIPKQWFVVEEIPRTRAGKTDRSRERLFEGAIELG